LTQGRLWSPFSTAFFASRPAPIITEGFEVLVQLVIAAMAMEPSATSTCWPCMVIAATGAATATPPACLRAAGIKLFSDPRKFCFSVASGTRSWGRRGPARLGTTVARSRISVAEKSGSGEPAVWKRALVLQ
jgi:hypothetical protein